MPLDWNALFSQIRGTAQERKLCELLFTCTPPGDERDQLQTYLAGLAPDAAVPNSGPPTHTKSRPRWGWGTRIAIWCAVLSVICFYATAYFNVANLQSVEEHGRPVDLWWFARKDPEAITPEQQRLSQQIADVMSSVYQLSEKVDTLVQKQNTLSSSLYSQKEESSKQMMLIEQSLSVLRDDMQRDHREMLEQNQKNLLYAKTAFERVNQKPSSTPSALSDWFWKQRSETRSPKKE